MKKWIRKIIQALILSSILVIGNLWFLTEKFGTYDVTKYTNIPVDFSIMNYRNKISTLTDIDQSHPEIKFDLKRNGDNVKIIAYDSKTKLRLKINQKYSITRNLKNIDSIKNQKLKITKTKTVKGDKKHIITNALDKKVVYGVSILLAICGILIGLLI